MKPPRLAGRLAMAARCDGLLKRSASLRDAASHLVARSRRARSEARVLVAGSRPLPDPPEPEPTS